MTKDEFKAAREMLKLSRKEMGAKLGGYGESALSLWETGKRKVPPAVAELIPRLISEVQSRS